MKSYTEDLRAIVQEPLPWTQLAGKSVLVAGATGLIGAALVEALLTLPVPVEVYAAGRNAERAAAWFKAYADNPQFHFVQMDVCQPIRGAQLFDYIIDAASSANPKSFATQPVEVMLSNFEGVRNLLDYGLHHGMQRFLYVSTGEIYGEGEGNFSEHDSGYVDCATPRACYPSPKPCAWLMLPSTKPTRSLRVSAMSMDRVSPITTTASTPNSYATSRPATTSFLRARGGSCALGATWSTPFAPCSMCC